MDDSKRYAALLRKALKEAAKNLQEQYPEFRAFNHAGDLRTYRKTPSGWSKHPERVVRAFLASRSFLKKTNREVVAEVAHWFAPYKPSQSIMTRPIHASSLNAIQLMIDQHGIKITVRPTDTLSKLKKAILAGYREDGADGPVAGTLAISEDFVVANGRPYRVDKARRHPSIRVTTDGKRQYLRCDLLLALLGDQG